MEENRIFLSSVFNFRQKDEKLEDFLWQIAQCEVEVIIFDWLPCVVDPIGAEVLFL